jgi:UDP-GlcNAc:undecaprenyl-phosphate GlcNAc-1-phosphate transferase
MNELILTLSFFLSFLLTIYGTPVAQKVAFRYKILDHPDGQLKKQKAPVPYMGGVIIYFAFISPVGLLFPFSRELLGILFAGSTILIVGLFDDLKALTPGIKFLFQIVATYILIKSGIQISLSFLPGWLNTTLSFLWILAVINAFNIIDIMDGLAPSVAMFSSLTIFIISIYNMNFIISILSLSLAASLMGFLKFNWQPAKIYLGDAGSMFIGLVIGALAIWGDYSKFNDFGFISGLLVLTVPIFDMVYVMLLRILKGKSPFFGSPDHFALRLKKKYDLSAEKTVAIIIIVQMFLSAIVILNFYTTKAISIATTILVLLFFSISGMCLARVKME